MRKIFISSHNDDEALFGSFTIMRHRHDVEVVVVYDSYVQVSRGYSYCTKEQRRAETTEALITMGVVKPPRFIGLRDDATVDATVVAETLAEYAGCAIWAPAYENDGNRHHNTVARAVGATITEDSPQVVRYLSYTSNGKSTSQVPVFPAHWSDIPLKLIALSCYHSQIEIPDCRPHFLRDQSEYYAA